VRLLPTNRTLGADWADGAEGRRQDRARRRTVAGR
jgi:hypothetical protein